MTEEKRLKKNADLRRWREKQKAQNPEKFKRDSKQHQLRIKYKITLEEFDKLCEQQGGLCGICGREGNSTKSRLLAVDHCHATGKIRGLLCNNCNTAIGLLNEDENLFSLAVKYLQTHK